MKELPKTLPWQHLNQKGVYELKEVHGLDYGFYVHGMSFGFKHGISISVIHPVDRPEKPLVRVRRLSGNSWGKGTWLIMREDFFMNHEDAIGYLKGETRVYKPKRKPELIRPMTEDQIKEYWDIKRWKQLNESTWQSLEDEDITVVVALETDEDEPTEYDQFYTVFPAYKDRGIPNTPAVYSEIANSSLEDAHESAIAEAKKIMALPIEQIRKFKWSMIE